MNDGKCYVYLRVNVNYRSAAIKQIFILKGTSYDRKKTQQTTIEHQQMPIVGYRRGYDINNLRISDRFAMNLRH